jgi:glycosyltransferase involved in cell wall biosynthesis
MRVACVNQDGGVQPDRKKGAAVHLREMRRSFAALGAEVVAIDRSDSAEIHQLLNEAWQEAPLDMVYERYALGAKAGIEFATDRNIPFVLEVNSPLIDEEERWRGPVKEEVRSLERLIFLNAAIIVAVSSEVSRYVLDQGADPERVSIFPNGVDNDRFCPRKESDPLRAELVPEGRFVLGFHGRLRGWHGFERLAEASARMLAEGLPIHLLLVGDGEFEEALDNVDIEHVTRIPWVDHDQIPRYVACFDALPLTYQPDVPCYFSPLKLAEAMACGVVPVVPDVGDLTKVVEDGRNGLVFAGDDLEAFIKAIRHLVQDGEAHRRLAEGAVETAASMSWKRIASYILDRTRPQG